MEQPTGEQDELNLELTLRTPVAPGPGDDFFLCMYCDRKLRNAQALGGHQNAHKHERSVAKRQRQQQIAAATRAQGVQYAPRQDKGPTGYGDRGGGHIVSAAEKARRMEAREAAAAAGGKARKRGNTSSEYGGIQHADDVDLTLRL